ncbi:hypothetical protein QL285_030695 [Trifolium repens]|nr:hypothetical protein QL285_030695 [Trifolium repens]
MVTSQGFFDRGTHPWERNAFCQGVCTRLPRRQTPSLLLLCSTESLRFLFLLRSTVPVHHPTLLCVCSRRFQQKGSRRVLPLVQKLTLSTLSDSLISMFQTKQRKIELPRKVVVYMLEVP